MAVAAVKALGAVSRGEGSAIYQRGLIADA